MEKKEYSALIGTAVASFILGIVILITGFGVFKCFQCKHNSKLLNNINKLMCHIVHLLFSLSTEDNTCIQPNTNDIYYSCISSMDFLCWNTKW